VRPARQLPLAASDRLSAYDMVLPTPDNDADIDLVVPRGRFGLSGGQRGGLAGRSHALFLPI